MEYVVEQSWENGGFVRFNEFMKFMKFEINLDELQVYSEIVSSSRYSDWFCFKKYVVLFKVSRTSVSQYIFK